MGQGAPRCSLADSLDMVRRANGRDQEVWSRVREPRSSSSSSIDEA